MSTGTNQERLQQNNEILAINNTKIQKAIQKANELPEYQDIEPIYASGDFNQVKVVGSGAYSYCKGYMSVQNSNSSFKIYKLNDDGTSTEIYSVSNGNSNYGIYAYLIDVIDNKLYFHCYIQYSEYAGNNLNYSILDLDTLQVTHKSLSNVGYGENNIYGTLVYTGGGLISYDSVWYKYTSIDWKNSKVNYVSTFDNSGAIHYFNDRIFGYKDYYTKESKIHNTISKSNKIVTDTFNPVFIPRTNDMICMSGGKLYYFNSDGSVGDYIKDLLIPSNAKFQWIDGDYYVDTVNKVVYKFDVTTLELNQVMSVKSVTNLSRKVTPYFSATGVGTFFLEANNNVNTLMGYKFYGKDYYPAGSNWANTESILEGSYAYTSSGIQIIGTMPNNGEINITPSTEEQTIPSGYTSGGTIEAVTSSIDSNIIAENIKEGVSILGVVGTYKGASMKEYSSVDEMNTDIDNITEGEIVKIINVETPKTITVDGTTFTLGAFFNDKKFVAYKTSGGSQDYGCIVGTDKFTVTLNGGANGRYDAVCANGKVAYNIGVKNTSLYTTADGSGIYSLSESSIVGVYLGDYNNIAYANFDVYDSNGTLVYEAPNKQITFYLKNTTMKQLVIADETISPEEYVENVSLVDNILGETT